MPANQELPPWMGQQPPPGSPPIPPPGPSWPGPPPPPPSASTGLLTFVGVVNLIFSLLCGCVSGMWAATWSSLQDDPDAIVAQLESQKEQIRVKIREELEKNKDQPVDPGLRVAIEQAVDPDTMKEVLIEVGRNPATPVIRTSTMIAGIAQAALFIGSILLLMRKNAGRVLSMLALLAFIGATLATWAKFSGFADAVSEKMGSKIAESTAYKDLPPADQNRLQEGLDTLPQVLNVFVTVVSIVALAWPVISLLVLAISRSVRDACVRSYPAG